MSNSTPWDFRSEEDLKVSLQYEKDGYVIEDADCQHLESMKQKIMESFAEFTKYLKRDVVELEQAHTVKCDSSNDLAYHVSISKNNSFNKSYYYAQENHSGPMWTNCNRRGQEFQLISLKTTMTYCQYTNT